MNFTAKDIDQFRSLGIEVSEVERQIERFSKGFPFLQIQAPAIVGKGILQMDEQQTDRAVATFDAFQGRTLKFTPASGAASRMFKDLFEVESALLEGNTVDWNSKTGKAVSELFAHLPRFAFYEALNQQLAKTTLPSEETERRRLILSHILHPQGLNYGNLPKGMLLFHRYESGSRTALEEHLVEAALYACDKSGTARLHFTVSPEHVSVFQDLVKRVQPSYEQKFGVRYEISFSEQLVRTNTVAVDSRNEAFRNADGSILFRPGGHGALLANLSQQNADIIFIKNIDNVVPDRLKDTTVRYKKALAGLVIEAQRACHDYARKLKQTPSDTALHKHIADFLSDTFCISHPKDWETKAAAYLSERLNRPIRACGMVRNEGEPGGGPFIAREPDGSFSPQILESSQLDLSNAEINAMFTSATHFNPVDLVCAVRDKDGMPFDLSQFSDPDTGFISEKSKDGKVLKALELPGLWNGAMSRWNSIFVEVPVITFNPVKTVLDLLRKEHQP